MVTPGHNGRFFITACYSITWKNKSFSSPTIMVTCFLKRFFYHLFFSSLNLS